MILEVPCELGKMKMDGLEDDFFFILGLPMFRGKLLVLGSGC